MNDLFEIRDANLSEDRKFRFTLTRIWDESKPKAAVIGLNPSTANAGKDDNTIHTLRKMLTRLGFGGFFMLNCFPLVSSKPEALEGIDINDSENTDNQYIVGDTAAECQVVIFAWGNFEVVKEKKMDERWIKMFPEAQCFGKNKNGSPCHPRAMLYAGTVDTVTLQPFNEATQPN